MQDLIVLYQVCVFRANRKKKMAAQASDWLRHFRLLLWNQWEELNKKLDRKQDLNVLYQVCVFRAGQKKKDGRPGLWLAETFSTSSLKLLDGIQRNLTGSKLLTSSTKFVFFGPIWKTRWPPWPLIGWDIFDFSDETAERNSKNLDRKQDLKVLYQVCVFRGDRKNKMAALASDWLRHFRLLRWNRWKEDLNVLYQVCVFRADRKNKMAALASDWLRHFRLLLWNRWTEFNETWQETRSQRLLPSLCFLGWSEKQDGRPSLWLAETFWTSSLKLLNRIRQNLKGSKISMPFTKSVFFGPIRKTRWPPWPMIGWDIFDFSSETAVRDSKKFDRKQDLNIFYQVVFLVHLSRRLKCTIVIMCCPSSVRRPSSLTFHIFDFSSETAEQNLTKLYRKVDLNVLYQVCVFRVDRKNKMAALASDWLRHFRLLLWNR